MELSRLWVFVIFAGCAHEPRRSTPRGVVIDRFSSTAGHLQVRTAQNHLPGPDQAVDFDQPPFITQSRGPAGETIRYYNFDVQPTRPALMYVFFAGDQQPLAGQHNVVDVIPGSAGTTRVNFFRVVRVLVPADYVADRLRDAAAIRQSGFALQETADLLNRPIVPRGSTARERLNGASTALERGWFRGQEVQWFRFDETQLGAGPTRAGADLADLRHFQPESRPARRCAAVGISHRARVYADAQLGVQPDGRRRLFSAVAGELLRQPRVPVGVEREHGAGGAHFGARRGDGVLYGGVRADSLTVVFSTSGLALAGSHARDERGG